MADNEKVLPDPIEIEGIRIGDDRFKIKARTDLDLNRRENTNVGLNSAARSPEKTVLTGATGFQGEVDATAIASGTGSYAFGPGTIAQGHYSFAFGPGAYSLGNSSFCHKGKGIYGISTDSSNFQADVPYGVTYGEGAASFNFSSAIADYSFSEGRGIAGLLTDNLDSSIGIFSHAEGDGRASGNYSHAEGESSASGNYSHAEGYRTIAKGLGSHAEGYGQFLYNSEEKTEYEREGRTRADGVACHAEGIRTFAAGNATHTEGFWTRANGIYCYARGAYNRAGGFYEDKASDYSCCSAIGINTISTGNYSISTGDCTRAYGECSVSLGRSTVASGQEQVVLGRLNEPKSNCAIIVGGGDNISVDPDKAENGVVQDNNGNFHTQKNIFEFDWGGNLWIQGSFLSGDEKKPVISSEDLKNYYTKTETTNIFLSKEDATEHLLPTVSQSDNGKILSVVNGVWTPVSIVNAEGVAY